MASVQINSGVFNPNPPASTFNPLIYQNGVICNYGGSSSSNCYYGSSGVSTGTTYFASPFADPPYVFTSMFAVNTTQRAVFPSIHVYNITTTSFQWWSTYTKGGANATTDVQVDIWADLQVNYVAIDVLNSSKTDSPVFDYGLINSIPVSNRSTVYGTRTFQTPFETEPVVFTQVLAPYDPNAILVANLGQITNTDFQYVKTRYNKFNTTTPTCTTASVFIWIAIDPTQTYKMTNATAKMLGGSILYTGNNYSIVNGYTGGTGPIFPRIPTYIVQPINLFDVSTFPSAANGAPSGTKYTLGLQTMSQALISSVNISSYSLRTNTIAGNSTNLQWDGVSATVLPGWTGTTGNSGPTGATVSKYINWIGFTN